jgi:two-component system response regulator
MKADAPFPRVLLVEDNENDELLARLALKAARIPIDLEVVRDGEEAVQFVLACPDAQLPALVLLDLNLPKMDGHEVLRRLQADERTRHLPVVVMSSSSEDRDVGRAYHIGARSYVCKPIGLEQLLSAMRLILTYWLSLNVAPRAGQDSPRFLPERALPRPSQSK